MILPTPWLFFGLVGSNIHTHILSIHIIISLNSYVYRMYLPMIKQYNIVNTICTIISN